MSRSSLKSRKILLGLFFATLISLSGCSNSNSNSNGSDNLTFSSPGGDTGTDAYNIGYEASSGASQALIYSFGGVYHYCEGLLPLHPEFNLQEQADYVRGCIDANS